MAKRNFIPLVPSGTINADASVAQLEQDVLAMDAKVGELAEDIGDTEQEIVQLKSQIDAVAEGRYILYFNLVANEYVSNTNGSFIAYNNWSRTDYIPVTGGETVHVKATVASLYNAFYDSDKTFISAFTVQINSDNYVSVPSNASYMALSNTTAGMQNTEIWRIVGEYGKTPAYVQVVNPFYFNRFTGDIRLGEAQTAVGAFLKFDKIAFKGLDGNVYEKTWSDCKTDLANVGSNAVFTESFDYTQDCLRLFQNFVLLYDLDSMKFDVKYLTTVFPKHSIILFGTDINSVPFGPVYDQFKVKRGIDCYWEDVMGKAESACTAGDNFLFSFATDCHFAVNDKTMYYNPTNEVIAAIDDSMCLDAIINGGDSIIYGCEDKTYGVMALNHVFSELNPNKVIYCIGNHDWNGVSGDGIVQNESWMLSNAETDALLMRHNKGIVKPTGADVKYFYRDFDDKKIRVIVLNTSDIDVEFVSSEITIDPLLTYGVRQAQLTWLTGTALNVPSDDWHIIIVMHVGLYLSADGFPGNNTLINKQSIIGILSAFVNKTTYSYSETDTDHDGYFTVSGSGTFSGAHGTLAAVFSGHAHADGYCNKDGFNAIQTEASYCEPGTTPAREVRTTDEFAIDCVEINKTDKEITLTRFGYGSDRSYSYS